MLKLLGLDKLPSYFILLATDSSRKTTEKNKPTELKRVSHMTKQPEIQWGKCRVTLEIGEMHGKCSERMGAKNPKGFAAPVSISNTAVECPV